MSEEKKDERKISVTVDNEQTKILAGELERQRQKNEKLMDMIASKELENDSFAEKKLEMYKQTNDTRYLDCKTEGEIKELSLSLMAETVERKNPKYEPPAGSPLTEKQWGNSQPPTYDAHGNLMNKEELGKKPFSSEREIFKFLKENERTDPIARHYYDEFWKQAVQKMKSGDKLEYRQDPESKNEGNSQPIEIKDFSQLKLGKSEIRQALDRADEIARQKIMYENERHAELKKKQGDKK
jgi:hypothetical protein